MISRKLVSSPLLAALAAALALLAGPAGARAGIVLSDNTGMAPSGTTDVSGGYYLASSFGTDSSSYTLDSVTLLLA